MSNPVLDHWALELQQFDIQFKHILGKNNVVADAISRLRTLGLYEDNGNYNVATTDDAIVVPRKLTSLIIVGFHNDKDHQGISCTANMIRHYFWWVGMHRDIHQHISNCQLCIQFLPNQLYTQPMHLEIPKVSFAGCAMDCIGPLLSNIKRQ